MASFRLINNTDTDLPFSNSFAVAAGKEETVFQLTYEMRRLQRAGLLTIIGIPTIEGDDELLSDYPDSKDPSIGLGGGGGGGTGDLGALLPALDGSVPEYAIATNTWFATVNPRKLILDGGNF